MEQKKNLWKKKDKKKTPPNEIKSDTTPVSDDTLAIPSKGIDKQVEKRDSQNLIATLQQELDKLKDGDKKELLTGEYPGPITINHSITLDGGKFGATIWCSRGPVVIINADHVTLCNLNLEISGDDKDRGTHPEHACALRVNPSQDLHLTNVEVKGNVSGLIGEEGEWFYPFSLAMGTLLESVPHSFLFRIHVPVPCKLESKMAGLTFSKHQLTPGLNEVEIHIESMRRDTLLDGDVFLVTHFLTRKIKLNAYVSAGETAETHDRTLLWEPIVFPSSQSLMVVEKIEAPEELWADAVLWKLGIHVDRNKNDLEKIWHVLLDRWDVKKMAHTITDCIAAELFLDFKKTGIFKKLWTSLQSHPSFKGVLSHIGQLQPDHIRMIIECQLLDLEQADAAKTCPAFAGNFPDDPQLHLWFVGFMDSMWQHIVDWINRDGLDTGTLKEKIILALTQEPPPPNSPVDLSIKEMLPPPVERREEHPAKQAIAGEITDVVNTIPSSIRFVSSEPQDITIFIDTPKPPEDITPDIKISLEPATLSIPHLPVSATLNQPPVGHQTIPGINFKNKSSLPIQTIFSMDSTPPPDTENYKPAIQEISPNAGDIHGEIHRHEKSPAGWKPRQTSVPDFLFQNPPATPKQEADIPAAATTENPPVQDSKIEGTAGNSPGVANKKKQAPGVPNFFLKKPDEK